MQGSAELGVALCPSSQDGRHGIVRPLRGLSRGLAQSPRGCGQICPFPSTGLAPVPHICPRRGSICDRGYLCPWPHQLRLKAALVLARGAL
ncbi:hypothetical protein H8959_011786 [Pygathrix nigripes]